MTDINSLTSSLESQIAKLKRNQERRIDRKNKKIAKEGGELLVASPSVKTETTRKCGNCGDVGHMSSFPSFCFVAYWLTRPRNQSEVPEMGRIQQGESGRQQSSHTRRAKLHAWN